MTLSLVFPVKLLPGFSKDDFVQMGRWYPEYDTTSYLEDPVSSRVLHHTISHRSGTSVTFVAFKVPTIFYFPFIKFISAATFI